MTPARPRYSRISREVSDLLVRANIKAPLVPVEDIAKLVGAKITFNNFQNEI